MKRNSLLIILFLLLAIACGERKIEDKGLTYSVTVPAGTKSCFIAGDMTGWAIREMNKQSDNQFKLLIPEAIPANKYKYYSGPLQEFEETDSSNGRSYVNNDVVNGWKELWNPDSAIIYKASSGIVKKVFLKSNYVDGRLISIWLPENYTNSEKYAVLYMHDGQMLFDSTITWNKQEWKVDEVISKLIVDGKIEKTIVIGINNNGNKRHAEYFPQKALSYLPDTIKTKFENLLPGGPKADDYLRFLVSELKPYIDKNYSTLSDAKHTYIAGSSMGGLISFYAICEYPNVFSGAACISTHWIGSFENNREIPLAFEKYAKESLPSPTNHKLYFDFGTVTLDANYEPYQKNIDLILKEKGYNSSNWVTIKFDGADHSERSWAKRFDKIITFLIEKP